jgi:hypothetical protein
MLKLTGRAFRQSNNPGLPLLQTQSTPFQRTHFITLTQEQSTLLTQHVKRIISPNATITHLGHAAMVIAMLRSNPPSTTCNILYSPCWLNGRRYLKTSPNQPSQTKSYIPICLSFAPLVFPDLHELVLERKATQEEIKRTLVKACRMSTNEYVKIKERKSMLPKNVAWMEEVGEQMWKYVFLLSHW